MEFRKKAYKNDHSFCEVMVSMVNGFGLSLLVESNVTGVNFDVSQLLVGSNGHEGLFHQKLQSIRWDMSKPLEAQLAWLFQEEICLHDSEGLWYTVSHVGI